MTPTQTQVNYIIWRIAAASLSYLNERAEDVAFKFSSQLSGQRQRPPRWQKCTNEVTQALGPLVGSLYVQRYFSELSKSAAVEMVEEIRTKFQDNLDNVDWMDQVSNHRNKYFRDDDIFFPCVTCIVKCTYIILSYPIEL